jgi:hypothetical protein
VLVRGFIAFSIRGNLNWDETYYASIAATARAGLGLYPFVQGYPPIPVMGGMGHICYIYVLALALFGPTVIGMRLMSFLASLVGLSGIFILARRWYGSGTALVAVTCTASSTLFAMTNSIRLDAFALAFVAWLLVLFASALDGPPKLRPHALVGIVAALGLEVHLHTVIVAMAVGAAYLLDAWRARSARKREWGIPVAGYVLGFIAGAVLFLAVNVLPSPETYFRTAALARLGMVYNEYAAEPPSMDTGRLAASFLAPATLVTKEWRRYRTVLHTQSPFASALWIGSLLPLAGLRRHPRDAVVRTLVLAAVAAGGVVFNGDSPIYLNHILPVLILPVAPFLTHGVTARGLVSWRAPAIVTILAMAVICALYTSSVPSILSRQRTYSAYWDVNSGSAGASWVRSRVSPKCHVAGDARTYIPQFMEYPRFTSTRLLEVRMGSAFYGIKGDEIEYWRRKNPDVVFDVLTPQLRAYLLERSYEQLTHDVWFTASEPSSGCIVRRDGD